MKISRDFLLVTSVIGVLAAGAVLYWSHQQVEHLTAASIEFAQARTTHRAALQDATIRLGHLQAQLLASQDETRAEASYDEWSRQQAEARAAVAALRQHFADLEPPGTSPIPAQPALVASAAHLRELGGRLLAGWRDYEQQGSGLTPRSRQLAATTLLPLIADEITPALAEVTAAEAADAERQTATFPRLIAPPRHLRLAALIGLGACLALLIATLIPRRKTPAKLLSAAWHKSATAPDSTPPMPANFDHNVAAMDRTLPKILVANHNAAESDTLSLLLTNAGYAVIGCDNGAVARDAIQRFQFALLLLDLRLPQHNGLELLREARLRQPALPAVLLCNPQEDVPLLETEIAGTPTQIVRRPLNPRTLLWSVSETLYPGENRQPREYSPYVPDPDDDDEPSDTPPADATAVAQPPSAPTAPLPPSPAAPEPPRSAPRPVPTAPSTPSPLAAPRPVPAAPPATPSPSPTAAPAPTLRLPARPVTPPRPAVEPEPPAPEPIAPPSPPPTPRALETAPLPPAAEAPEPPARTTIPAPVTPPLAGTDNPFPSASPADGQPVVRKKLVRRRLPSSDEA